MTEPLLSVEDLHVWFDLPRGGELHAVQGVSLTVGTGERFGLVGESGCGKTTTILATMGLLPPNATVAGRVLLDGVDILAQGEDGARPHRWTDIAMIFQGAMNALNPVQTVGAQIVEPMELHGIASGTEARARAGELLELVGIPRGGLDRYPHELSGGMRQRAAIAMALACQPRILLADEPTTALDVMVQAQILDLLQSLSKGFGLTVVFVTHDLPLVAQVCDRAAVMYGGILAETGPVEDLYHDPRHPYTRMLFAAVPDPTGGSEVVSIPGAPPRLDLPIAGCPFAPRCDRAFEPCASVRPAMIELGPDHEAACHRNDPAAWEVS
ncbi:MAG: ABC transporter ATP-binding protein [Candidatus Velamenicoccus archaeovorus]